MKGMNPSQTLSGAGCLLHLVACLMHRPGEVGCLFPQAKAQTEVVIPTGAAADHPAEAEERQGPGQDTGHHRQVEVVGPAAGA